MHVKKIRLQNYGPMKDISIEPRIDANGNPIPLLLVGTNGSGKTILLSSILDAFVEAKRRSFREISETKTGKYAKLASSQYISSNATFLSARITFDIDNTDLHFDEIVANIDHQQLREQQPDLYLEVPQLGNDPIFSDGGFFKRVNPNAQQIKAITSLPFLYLPTFRYELPSWLSEEANISLIKPGKHYGSAPVNSISVSFVSEMKDWLANLLLDREIYERQTVSLMQLAGWNSTPENNVPSNSTVLLGYNGPNHSALTLVNQILTQILLTKSDKYSAARLGFGTKQQRNISVFATIDGKEELIAHDIQQLSSGQLMTLIICAQLIKNHEVTTGVLPSDLSRIEGVLLVDEIDMSLHIDAQLKLLPKVLRSFPKVQIIASTHSPLFILGMQESGETDIVSLPTGKPILVEQFEEYRIAYDTYLSRNEKYLQMYLELQRTETNSSTPTIYVEGKTDTKHLRFALERLKKDDKFSQLKFNFSEGQHAPNGDSDLLRLCKESARTQRHQKLIFLFDRDNSSIVSQVLQASGEPKSWGNNVISMCIVVPEWRKTHTGICIEHLYRDDDLLTTDPTTKRRLYFTDEIRTEISATTKSKSVTTRNKRIAHETLRNKVYDDDVDNICDEDGNKVVLSKNAFYECIIANEAISKGFDFTGFEPTFETLTKILAD
jgi:AAA domain, putative AbiEii toxin, Type IV TA system